MARLKLSKGDLVRMKRLKPQHAQIGIVVALKKTDKVWKEPVALVDWPYLSQSWVRQRHLRRPETKQGDASKKQQEGNE